MMNVEGGNQKTLANAIWERNMTAGGGGGRQDPLSSLQGLQAHSHHHECRCSFAILVIQGARPSGGGNAGGFAGLLQHLHDFCESSLLRGCLRYQGNQEGAGRATGSLSTLLDGWPFARRSRKQLGWHRQEGASSAMMHLQTTSHCIGATPPWKVGRANHCQDSSKAICIRRAC
eukprot:scaffold16854_cov39-Tisochrysis_lutea.AAC.3